MKVFADKFYIITLEKLEEKTHKKPVTVLIIKCQSDCQHKHKNQKKYEFDFVHCSTDGISK
jgi:hypothetical protein